MISLLHAPISARAFHQWAAHRNMMSARHDFDLGAAVHTLLTETFSYGAIQPFRVFAPQSGDWSLYGYVQQDTESLMEQAAITAMPETQAVLPLDAIRIKPMPEAFPSARRLGFDCLVRPVVRGKKGERDLFQHRMETEASAVGTRPVLDRQTVYCKWLEGKLAGAATLEQVTLAGFERTRVLRNGRMSEGPDAILHGTLTIADPVAFTALLKQGIGRHKAYGYGMILLRPPGRSALGR
nr:type I-E CRISPR-associated protein Cas6/Cse3/CasE [uncultured Cohaesibacter sp.]